jgi:hypothetical protein
VFVQDDGRPVDDAEFERVVREQDGLAGGVYRRRDRVLGGESATFIPTASARRASDRPSRPSTVAILAASRNDMLEEQSDVGP